MASWNKLPKQEAADSLFVYLNSLHEAELYCKTVKTIKIIQTIRLIKRLCTGSLLKAAVVHSGVKLKKQSLICSVFVCLQN